MTRDEAITDVKITYSCGNNKLASEFIPALEQESILDKIRTEIEVQEKRLMSAGYTAYNVDIAFNSIKSVLAESEARYEL